MIASKHKFKEFSHNTIFFSSHIFRTKDDRNLAKKRDNFRHWANIKDPVFDEFLKTATHQVSSRLRQKDAGRKLSRIYKGHVTLAQV